MKYVLLLFPIFLLTSCIEEEIPRLPPNIFADENTVFFTLVGVELTDAGFELRDARVEFTSNYDQLSTDLRESAGGIFVDGPGISQVLDPSRTSFVVSDLSVGTQACYLFRYTGASSSRTELCFDVE